MWTQTTYSWSRSITLMASSKSWASTGSVVHVGSRRMSARSSTSSWISSWTPSVRASASSMTSGGELVVEFELLEEVLALVRYLAVEFGRDLHGALGFGGARRRLCVV